MNIEKIKYEKIARRDFISLSRDVIKEWVTEAVGHKVVYGFSDELSLGIVAFNEAIDKYLGHSDFYEYAKSYVMQKMYSCVRNTAREKADKKI